MPEEDDLVTRLLSEGWHISGYSTAMMAAGAMVHSILLVSGIKAIAVNIVVNGAKELGRTTTNISPIQRQRGGLWS